MIHLTRGNPSASSGAATIGDRPSMVVSTSDVSSVGAIGAASHGSIVLANECMELLISSHSATLAGQHGMAIVRTELVCSQVARAVLVPERFRRSN